MSFSHLLKSELVDDKNGALTIRSIRNHTNSMNALISSTY